MKILNRIFVAVFLMLLVVQCDIADDKSLNSPNAISPESVDPDYLLNSMQLSARNVYRSTASLGREMTRMGYMFGTTYQNAYNSQNFNTIYQTAYSSLFIDAKSLIPLAEERGLNFHVAIAKTLKAYALLTMVDVFGDVPYEEALDPSNFNPKLSAGKTVYDAALADLDDAIALLKAKDWLSAPKNDLYYGSKSSATRADAWLKAANTIKLKAYLNIGNLAGIDALSATGDLILTPADDFKFAYSINDVNPDSRHPLFVNNYLNGANNYMAVSYMNMLIFDKSIADPRIRYYFYRQETDGPTTIQENSCFGSQAPSWYSVNDPYCTFDPPYEGYWGRDHLNDEGIPTDTDKRTIWGVYPAGGQFDANQSKVGNKDMGYAGEGFEPILMSSFTHFMLAEAAIRSNKPAVAKGHYDAGITASLETVRDFGAKLAKGTNYEDLIDNTLATYLAEAGDNWNNEGAMRANSKEYYFALFPNGLEAYNLMRRTGYPNRLDNLQPAVDSNNPGQWYNTFTYPAVMVERNSNISPKPDNKVRTFWDTEAYTKRATASFDF